MDSVQPIAITGLGAVSAQGIGCGELLRGLERMTDGLGRQDLLATARWAHVPLAQVHAVPVDDGGRSRSLSLAVLAVDEAIGRSGLTDHSALGVVVGACTGGMLESEAFMRRLHHRGSAQFDIGKAHVISSVTDAIADRLGSRGMRATVSDACASGASAIAVACDWIRQGLADVVLAGGVDALTMLTLNGFGALMVIAESGCRPFDVDRSGMSLGEGAGFLVLESMAHAHARGGLVLGHVAGWSVRCDGYHVSGPHPEGEGIYQAMVASLQRAGIGPGQVGYLNAHGSATVDNDKAESCAIVRVFADQMPKVSSTKRYLGHTLGAAGALEAIVSLMAIDQQVAWGNLGLEQLDTELGVPVTASHQSCRMDYAMSNSLGFGGVNASVVLGGACR